MAYRRMAAWARQTNIVKCRECGETWLFGRWRRIGLCTRCLAEREFKRDMLQKVLKALPSHVTAQWSERESIILQWKTDEGLVEFLEVERENLVAHEPALAYYLRPLMTAKEREGREEG